MLNIKICGLLMVITTVMSCQDVVDYNDNYDDGLASNGAPVINGVYDAEDREFAVPLTEGAFEDMLVLKGENLSYATKVMLNDVEIDLSTVYATSKTAYFPIPRTIPGEVTNKLYYETKLGNASYDFSVKIPELQVIGLTNEFAKPGSSVKVEGAYFDLYGFGDENSTAAVKMNGQKLEVDSLTQQYMSVVIPENASNNSTIEFTWNTTDGMKSIKVPYRNTNAIIWDLSRPENYGLWAGKDLITDGSNAGDPESCYGSYFRVKGSYDAWSWNNLPCGGFNMPAEVVAHPADYWFKFEVNSSVGTPFYESGTAGYLIQLNGGKYSWNPSANGSFNTYGKWITIRLDLTQIATKGVENKWTSLNWIMQPTASWTIDHSFANIRIEKK